MHNLNLLEFINTFVLVIGSTLTLFMYYRNSEGQDKLELNVEIIPIQKGTKHVLLDIKTSIANKGKVRAKIPMNKLYLHLFQYPHEDYTQGYEAFKLNGSAEIPIVQSKENDNEDYTWINGDTTQIYHRYIQIENSCFYLKALVTLIYNDKRKDWQNSKRPPKIIIESYIQNNLSIKNDLFLLH